MLARAWGEGLEQHHDANDARETRYRKKGRPAVPPRPQEGERNDAEEVLRHHGVQPSLRSLPAPHVCKESGRERRDAGPHETLSPQRDIHLLQARLLRTTSQDVSLGIVTRLIISP